MSAFDMTPEAEHAELNAAFAIVLKYALCSRLAHERLTKERTFLSVKLDEQHAADRHRRTVARNHASYFEGDL